MRLFLLLLSLSVLFIPKNAMADPKPWIWSWKESHWKDQNFQPHLNDPKLPHNSQWGAVWGQEPNWEPENWVNSAGSIERVIKGFYNADIIVEQKENWDNIPVLVVGDGYMRLSGLDKRRVAAFVDYAYNITRREQFGMYYIYFDRADDEPLGVYTRYGLQLQ